MDYRIAAAMIAGVLVGACTTDRTTQVNPAVHGYGDQSPDDSQPTAGSVHAIVPTMDDRFGHDDRFGYDVPHRMWPARQAH